MKRKSLTRRYRDSERRQYFKPESDTIVTLEVIITIIFWGLWAYLIAPLLSVGLWLAGIYLFKDRILSMGGYEAFINQAVNYGYVILLMGIVLFSWVVWNQQRYGKRNQRTVIPEHVSSYDTGHITGLNEQSIEVLKTSRNIIIHYGEDSQPVIEAVMDDQLTPIDPEQTN